MSDKFYGHQMNFSIVRVDEHLLWSCTLTHTVDTIDTVKKNRWVRGSELAKMLVPVAFRRVFKLIQESYRSHTEVIQESYSLAGIHTHKK